MTREEAAFNEGLAVGQRFNYAKGDLFREDFEFPINPYIRNQVLRQQFQYGLKAALGDAFQTDLEIWLRIANELLVMHKLRDPTDIRREVRNLSKNGLLNDVVIQQEYPDSSISA